MRLLDVRTTQIAVMLTLSVLFVSGCSGSGDSSPVESQSMNGAAEQENNATDGETADDEIIPNDTQVSDNSASNQVDSASDDSAPDDSDTVATDPVDQATTQVNFEITVPAYQSNALQVALTWGDVQATAGWVGDELWSLSLNFPSDTEHLLTIIFSDDNGSIELGTYEQIYRTGFNDAESLIISAEQFATDQSDTDNDGTSNIDELIVGSDPLVNEDSLLEIRDTTEVSLEFITDSFESRIPEERPYNEFFEEQLVFNEGGRPPSGASHIIEINIDENGNGMLFDSRLEGVGISPIETTYTGARTHSENSIQWDGKLEKRQDLADLYVTTISDNTVSVSDEQTWNYVETYRHTHDTSDEQTTITSRQIDLVGEAIEGTSFCQPVSGTVEIEITRPRDNNGSSTQKSITKEINDRYWRVRSTVTGDEPSEAEYFAREFDSTFQCDFVEF